MSDTPQNFYKKFLGRSGENKAAKFLISKKYLIAEKNYVNVFGEIDIIAFDGDTVVFVEVKTRTNDSFGLPGDAVDYYKRKKYVRCAEKYLYDNDLLQNKARFDVIEILSGNINHIENAFEK